VLSAAAPLSGRPPEKNGPVLDCPIDVDVDQFAWLELLRRVLLWPSHIPGIVWCEDPAPRMLVSLGPMPEKALGSLLSPSQGSRFVWPLTTDRAEAREEASAQLGQALDHDAASSASLGERIDVLARLAPNYVS
jgi:hypothetical protein